ncbi:MAG: Fe-S cluster assembly protein SufD [Gammaproteobacteria bacterium]
MSAGQNQGEWLEEFKQGLNQSEVEANSSNSLDSLRREAVEALMSEPLPFRKMERWRYTPVAGLFKLPLNILKNQPANDTGYEELFSMGLDSHRFAVINGHAHFLGDINELPAGVIFSTMHDAAVKHEALLSQYAGKAMSQQGTQNRLQASLVNKDSKLFQYLNQSISPDGIFIHVPEGIKLEKPVEVVFFKSGNQADLVQTHNVVVLEKDAAMTLHEKHVDEEASQSFCNNQLEMIIGDNASLQHYYLQQQGSSGWHRQGMHRIQAEASRYRGWYGCCGSQWSRLETTVIFSGDNAESDVQGIQLALNGQLSDIHLDTRHDQPGCHSEQHFRGLVTGKSKIVFDGNITVSQDAQKTIAHLSDNNLMLTRNAEIDAKPQLEIYADDVQCSHGTSIGELDEQSVFYLRSRGISEQQARNLLSIGFVAEQIDKIELEAFRQYMLDLLEIQLQAAQKQENPDDGQ